MFRNQQQRQRQETHCGDWHAPLEKLATVAIETGKMTEMTTNMTTTTATMQPSDAASDTHLAVPPPPSPVATSSIATATSTKMRAGSWQALIGGREDVVKARIETREKLERYLSTLMRTSANAASDPDPSAPNKALVVLASKLEDRMFLSSCTFGHYSDPRSLASRLRISAMQIGKRVEAERSRRRRRRAPPPPPPRPSQRLLLKPGGRDRDRYRTEGEHVGEEITCKGAVVNGEKRRRDDHPRSSVLVEGDDMQRRHGDSDSEEDDGDGDGDGDDDDIDMDCDRHRREKKKGRYEKDESYHATNRRSILRSTLGADLYHEMMRLVSEIRSIRRTSDVWMCRSSASWDAPANAATTTTATTTTTIATINDNGSCTDKENNTVQTLSHSASSRPHSSLRHERSSSSHADTCFEKKDDEEELESEDEKERNKERTASQCLPPALTALYFRTRLVEAEAALGASNVLLLDRENRIDRIDWITLIEEARNNVWNFRELEKKRGKEVEAAGGEEGVAAERFWKLCSLSGG